MHRKLFIKSNDSWGIFSGSLTISSHHIKSRSKGRNIIANMIDTRITTVSIQFQPVTISCTDGTLGITEASFGKEHDIIAKKTKIEAVSI